VAGPTLRQQLEEALEALAVLRTENEALRDRIAHLEAELGKNSTNSSKPPSGDPVEVRKKRAQRRAEARAAKRAQGKQPGAPGAHLKRRTPDEIVEHRPTCCGGCGADLTGSAVIGEVVRQVIDLPPVRPTVTDHVAYRCRCVCGAVTVAELPPEARAPTCWGPEVRSFAVYLLCRQHLPVERCAELLADLLGAPVSTGWLCQIQLEAAGKLYPFITGLKDRLGAAPVVHADETGTRVLTTKHWMHTLTTNLLTLIAVHPKRGVEAFRDIGVIPDYRGTIVHDVYSPYEVFDQIIHAQCGIHLIRHLQDVGATDLFTGWTAQMITVLLDAKTASETAADQGLAAVEAALAAALRSRYHDTLDVALFLLPDGPKPRLRHQGGWTVAQRKAWNLATRMRTDADQVLRLLDDTRVPLDNNVAERALRMVKISTRSAVASTASPEPKPSPPSAPTSKPLTTTTRTSSACCINSSPPAHGYHRTQLAAPERLRMLIMSAITGTSRFSVSEVRDD